MTRAKQMAQQLWEQEDKEREERRALAQRAHEELQAECQRVNTYCRKLIKELDGRPVILDADGMHGACGIKIDVQRSAIVGVHHVYCRVYGVNYQWSSMREADGGIAFVERDGRCVSIGSGHKDSLRIFGDALEFLLEDTEVQGDIQLTPLRG